MDPIARDDGSIGSYSVGFVLYYPTESDQVNGAGVVDYPNSVYYHVIHPLYGAPGGVPSVQREEFTFPLAALPRTEDSMDVLKLVTMQRNISASCQTRFILIVPEKLAQRLTGKWMHGAVRPC